MRDDRGDAFGCELVTGKLTPKGYARIGGVGAHVVAWEAVNGPVPDGLVIDHGCSRRNCVAVHHLEAVTQSENLLRRSWAYRSRIKRCPKGHDMKLNAVVIPETKGRVCRTCNREAAAQLELENPG